MLVFVVIKLVLSCAHAKCMCLMSLARSFDGFFFLKSLRFVSPFIVRHFLYSNFRLYFIELNIVSSLKLRGTKLHHNKFKGLTTRNITYCWHKFWLGRNTYFSPLIESRHQKKMMESLRQAKKYINTHQATKGRMMIQYFASYLLIVQVIIDREIIRDGVSS